MNVPLYGTKQAAYCFFKTFASRIKNMTYKQSKADPCLYFAWISGEMVVFVAWVNDVMVLGPPSLVEQVQHLEKSFTCKREGELTEYVGSKLTFSHDDDGKGTVKFTQPVLIKKINDEYKMTDEPVSKTPAVAGQVLVKGDGEGTVTSNQMEMYRSATVTCMFMMQWSRPDIFNAVQGLARHMTAPREAHAHALMTLLKYVTHTNERGLVRHQGTYGAQDTSLRYMVDQTRTMQQIRMIAEVYQEEEYSGIMCQSHSASSLKSL
jgi:hypothetical protein